MKEKVQWKKVWRAGTSLFALAFALWLLVEGLASVSLATSAGKVTARGANIREEASVTSTAVGSTKENDKIEILGQTVGADGKVWYQIYVNGTATGFIRSDLVEITDGSTPPSIEGTGTATTTPNPSTGTSAGTVEAEQVSPVGGKVSGSNKVRVRTSPSTANNNNILTSVNSGTEVTVVARADGADNKVWYQIKFTADNKEIIGYIRSDYVTLSGELKPLSEVQVTPSPEPVQPSEPPKTEEPDQKKRYETKLINEKWYILDYNINKQFEIDKLFSAADEYKKLYEEEHGKVGAQKVWLFILGFLALGFLGCAAYLVYRLKEYKESAFIASIERNTVSSRARTAERPRNGGSRPSGDRPVIREGVDSQRTGGQRPQGQRPAGGQGGQRPAGDQGQRPENVQGGQRPAGSQGVQRPVNAQGGQRPAGAQGVRRPAGSQGVQRPVNAQGGQRPAGAQGVQRPVGTQGGQRPAGAPSQRPAAAPERRAVRPQNTASSANRGKSVNFMSDEDDVDFEVLNWDGDEE